MTIRIKFAKFGLMRFIGHLDVMRYFQKAIRRSGIDVAYSGGFHPHQIMSFANPLGMGVTSDGEYVDVELNSMISTDDIFNKLSASLTDGFKLINVTLLNEKEPNKKKEAAMALITCADYLASFDKNKSFDSAEKLEQAISKLNNKEQIIVTKKTKSGESEIDLKPHLYLLTNDYEGFYNQSNIIKVTNNPKENALIFDESLVLYMRVSQGSKMNIKPEIVIEALCNEINIPFDKYAYRLHRMELYGKEDKFVPLELIK